MNSLTISSDGEICCCNWNCKVGDDNEENIKLEVHDRNMTCMSTLPNLMKLSVSLFDYLEDDMCFEFSALLRQHEFIASYDDE